MSASLIRRVAAVVCLVVFLLAPSARGQGPDDEGPLMQAGPFALPYSARSLSAFTRIVGFDKDQATAARALRSPSYSGSSTRRWESTGTAMARTSSGVA